MLNETEAIEIATKFVEERKIDCRFARAAPPFGKFSTWQIEFNLILENIIQDPDIVVVEVDIEGNTSFLGMI
jgi:hypothetical protein